MSTAPFDPITLLGLPLAEARRRMAQSPESAGAPLSVVRAEPPRPRRPFPAGEDWRVARARRSADGAIELVVVPPIVLGLAAPGPDAP